jgi:hypothetical protein
MICSHLVNLSTLFGAILSWGILWPVISKQKGNWYPANVPESSMTSLLGYKVCLIIFTAHSNQTCSKYLQTTFMFVQSFLCVALIMGDGLYHFIKVTVITVNNIKKGTVQCALRKPNIPTFHCKNPI